ncbi:PEGA domain-containing protein [Candidatus Saccharibacteria bacterium]|nr:PEGA domain-containing protein [Candidatus Saccharibacteria bacterium]
MDPEQVKKRQTLRVLFSEAMMVLSVIIIMTVLIMITSGYWINQNFEVERQGMLQVYSSPTGADIIVDGDSGWLAKTNGSKIVSGGEHEVKIAKEGYDTWTKKVNVREGLMYRLPYVRLFPLERETEKVGEYDVAISSVSPDRNLMLIINNTTSWRLLHLNKTEVNTTNVDVSKIFDLGDEASLSAENIASVKWSIDGNRVLVKTYKDGQVEWALVDIKHADKSINLSKIFDEKFDNIKFVNHSGDTLLVEGDGNLRKISVEDQSLSKVLATKVSNFDIYNGGVIYVANDDGVKRIYSMKDLEDDAVLITELGGEKTFATVTRFYEDEYLVIVNDDKFYLYIGSLPKEDNDESFEKILEAEIGFMPETIKAGTNGEFFVVKNGKNVATLDLESEKVLRFEVDAEKIGWVDNYMMYAVDDDGTLFVYDYDGLNRRELSKNASGRFSVTICEDKWLYYFSDGWLVRENLMSK